MSIKSLTLKYLHIIVCIIFFMGFGSFTLIMSLNAAKVSPAAMSGVFITTPVLAVFGGLIGFVIGLYIQGRKGYHQKHRHHKQTENDD